MTGFAWPSLFKRRASSLLPGQPFALPARHRAAMPAGVLWALEPVLHVIHIFEAGGLGGFGGGDAAGAGAAQEIDVVAMAKIGLRQGFQEFRVLLHRRKDLPLDQHRLLAGLGQVGQADKAPFGVGAHIAQRRGRVAHQRFPNLSRRNIFDHSHPRKAF